MRCEVLRAVRDAECNCGLWTAREPKGCEIGSTWLRSTVAALDQRRAFDAVHVNGFCFAFLGGVGVGGVLKF